MGTLALKKYRWPTRLIEKKKTENHDEHTITLQFTDITIHFRPRGDVQHVPVVLFIKYYMYP